MVRAGHQLWWAVLGDSLLDLGSADARAAISRFTSRVALYQRRSGLPLYWFNVFETEVALHGNVVFVGHEKIASSLRRSFSEYLRSDRALQPVRDVNRLTRSYLVKEGTQQAMRSCHLHPNTRRKGSHRIEGGGDRVRLSPALRADALAVGAIEPWQRTHAKRAAYLPLIAIRPALLAHVEPVLIEAQEIPKLALRPAGQMWLFPEVERPAIRLKDYHAGQVSPSVSLEVEHLRKRLGVSQRELARRAGISQPTFANAIRGHDGLSRRAAERLKMALKEAA